MIEVPADSFALAGERKPHGFKFHYKPEDPAYGIGITTDGVIPQLHNVQEAVRVGQSLQMAIFGVPAAEKALTYV